MKHSTRVSTKEYEEHCKKDRWGQVPSDMITSRVEYQDVPGKPSFAECCGALLCSPENFHLAEAGVMVCFTPEKMTLPMNHGEFTYHQVKGDGEWINIKLLHSENTYMPTRYLPTCPENYGNVYSLYTQSVRNHPDITQDVVRGRYLHKAYPDGLYLSVLTKDQIARDGELTFLLDRGFTLEWESPTFSNHNYSDDPNRLTMYVLRKGEK